MCQLLSCAAGESSAFHAGVCGEAISDMWSLCGAAEDGSRLHKFGLRKI